MAIMEVMDEYLQEYEKVNRPVKHYDTFEELYDDYMKVGMS